MLHIDAGVDNVFGGVCAKLSDYLNGVDLVALGLGVGEFALGIVKLYVPEILAVFIKTYKEDEPIVGGGEMTENANGLAIAFALVILGAVGRDKACQLCGSEIESLAHTPPKTLSTPASMCSK